MLWWGTKEILPCHNCNHRHVPHFGMPLRCRAAAQVCNRVTQNAARNLKTSDTKNASTHQMGDTKSLKYCISWGKLNKKSASTFCVKALKFCVTFLRQNLCHILRQSDFYSASNCASNFVSNCASNCASNFASNCASNSASNSSAIKNWVNQALTAGKDKMEAMSFFRT